MTRTRYFLFPCINRHSIPGAALPVSEVRGGESGSRSMFPARGGGGDETYRTVFEDVVMPAARDFQPELVVSAGFDAHAADPLAGMGVTEAGFAAMARRARDIAETHADGRLIAFLEGGYDPPALARSVVATLAVLDNADSAEQTNLGADAPHSQGDAQE